MGTRIYNPGKQIAIWMGSTPHIVNAQTITEVDLPRYLVEEVLKHQDYKHLTLDLPGENLSPGTPITEEILSKPKSVPSKVSSKFDPYDEAVTDETLRAYATEHNLQLSANISSEALRDAVADHMFDVNS